MDGKIERFTHLVQYDQTKPNFVFFFKILNGFDIIYVKLTMC